MIRLYYGFYLWSAVPDGSKVGDNRHFLIDEVSIISQGEINAIQ